MEKYWVIFWLGLAVIVSVFIYGISVNYCNYITKMASMGYVDCMKSQYWEKIKE